MRKAFLFALLVATNIIINLDHGIIPAVTLQIEKDLHIDNSELGYLGSLVYFGIVVVSLVSGKLFIHFNAKVILIVSYIGMIASLALFTIEYNQTWPYFVLRFITGGAQAPMLIYFPVWIDHFGKEKKTIWMTILSSVIPLGVFLGYVMSSIISYLVNWQTTFYGQVGLLIPCFITFCFVNNIGFDIKASKAIIQVQDSVAEELDVLNPNYLQLLKELAKEKVWICVTLTLCVMYFVVTGIQFWISNYMETVMMEPIQKVNTVFAIVSITAPVFGCIAGGFISQLFGGYGSTSALSICLLYAIIGSSCSVVVPYVGHFWIFVVFTWGLLFFGGALVPPLMGIVLDCVQPKIKAFANSKTITLINLLGYLPAPTVYGQLSEINDQAGIIFLMTYPCVGILLLSLAIKFQKNQQLNNNKNSLLY